MLHCLLITMCGLDVSSVCRHNQDQVLLTKHDKHAQSPNNKNKISSTLLYATYITVDIATISFYGYVL
jgi:hypothetical protein